MIGTLLNLIQQTVSKLPDDVRLLLNSLPQENETLKIMREAMQISEKTGAPICQDTGLPYFWIQLPSEWIHLQPVIEKNIILALEAASQKGFLRPNSVDPLTGKNPGDNTGVGLPLIDWEVTHKKEKAITCSLLLKGGGSENVSGQYALPFSPVQAGRDMNGIVKTVLYHVHQAQGRGCAPGILGIGIGGDRASSLKLAKKQLFRSLNDQNPDEKLSALENEILQKGNQLNIGPMGLGGNPTLLAVKAAAASRHPASFFISISYLCWVARRGTCQLPII